MNEGDDSSSALQPWKKQKDSMFRRGLRREGQKQRLLMSWTERGGPLVTPPTRHGFGTRLIEHSLAAQDDGAVLDYDPAGLSCRFRMDLE